MAAEKSLAKEQPSFSALCC